MFFTSQIRWFFGFFFSPLLGDFTFKKSLIRDNFRLRNASQRTILQETNSLTRVRASFFVVAFLELVLIFALLLCLFWRMWIFRSAFGAKWKNPPISKPEEIGGRSGLAEKTHEKIHLNRKTLEGMEMSAGLGINSKSASFSVNLSLEFYGLVYSVIKKHKHFSARTDKQFHLISTPSAFQIPVLIEKYSHFDRQYVTSLANILCLDFSLAPQRVTSNKIRNIRFSSSKRWLLKRYNRTLRSSSKRWHLKRISKNPNLNFNYIVRKTCIHYRN